MATTTQSLTVPAKEKSKQDCHCGCAPCVGTCCRLDCIVKPHFFCGQLLTDADLSALLKWARDRFGLSRYRHGWGVVCGLDVRCGAAAAQLIVTPGYAVDCCGNDIIVCQDKTLDLKDLCREEEDPCADLRLQVRRTGPGIPINEDVNRVPAPDHEPEGELEGVRVVDIYLSYDEEASDPTTALGRSSCKQVDECEYSRTRESYKLTPKRAVAGVDPVLARAQKWHEGYDKCLDVLKDFRATFPQGFPLDDVKPWLVRWIDAHSQYQLCGQRKKICDWTKENFTERDLIRALFELVQACRHAYLNCDCFGCDEDSGVPIARVWILPDDRKRQQTCRIVAIDSYPPYRRPIQPECWPAPLGSVNVGRFIWHRWDEVCRATADLGMVVKKGQFLLPKTLSELEGRLNCDPFVECREPRTVMVYEHELLGSRVVGFCKTETQAILEVDVSHTELEATPVTNRMVAFHYVVRNTGNADLTDVKAMVNITRDGIDAESSKTIGILKPGGKHEWTETQDPGKLSTTVTGTGRDSGSGRELTQSKSDAYTPPVNFGGNVVATAPARARAAGTSAPDDLTSIKGIKAGRLRILKAAGITNFEILASTPAEELKRIFPTLTDSDVNEWKEAAKKQLG